MKTVCIIGAGLAGLCSARHALAKGMSITVFEQTSQIGGTWVYNEKIGKDDYGLKIHSSMYKGLRTNLPKEIMGFPDFPFPEDTKKSYLSAEQVLEFLNLYTDAFDIRRHIKFLHHVLTVRNEGDHWEVKAKDLQTGNEISEIYDFVIVCNGHYSTPAHANIEGIETFPGKSIHSHEYRNADCYKDENVLVIGAGPSGIDIAMKISEQASKVFLSHHLPDKLHMSLPENFEQRSDVLNVTGDQVEFTDGAVDRISAIIYCTGYKYNFPFLDAGCVSVEDNFIQPLYKHCININFPTMAFIGLPFYSAVTQMMDLQVRFVFEFYSGRKELPSQEEMRLDTDKEMAERWAKGYRRKKAHMLGPLQEKYFNELSEVAGIENVKPVVTKILYESRNCIIRDYQHLDKIIFKIIDDETFLTVRED